MNVHSPNYPLCRSQVSSLHHSSSLSLSSPPYFPAPASAKQSNSSLASWTAIELRNLFRRGMVVGADCSFEETRSKSAGFAHPSRTTWARASKRTSGGAPTYARSPTPPSSQTDSPSYSYTIPCAFLSEDFCGAV